jgi:ACS family glucarate transporter-like MFS transporter
MGMGEATPNPGSARVIREWFPARERGIANTMLTGGSYAGPAICALVVGALLEKIGWRLTFGVAGALGLVWCIVWKAVYNSPEKVSWLDPEERKYILAKRQLSSINVIDSGTMGLLDMLRTRAMWGLLIAQSVSAYCSYLFLAWLPSYLHAVRHLTLGRTGVLTALPYAVALVFSIGLGYFSDKLLARQPANAGRRRFIVAMTMTTTAIVIICVPFAQGLPALICLLSLALTGIATNSGQFFALLCDLLTNAGTAGKAMGLYIGVGSLFSLSSPIVTGYIISITGHYDDAFYLAGLLMFFGGVVCMLLANKPMQISKPKD